MGLGDTYDLLREALQGDEAARDLLLERVRPRLVLWAAGRLSPALRAKVEPEDVAQDILMAVHKGLSGFDGREQKAFYAWLFTVGENRIRDLVDHHGALKRRLPPPFAFSQTSPSQAAVRREAVEGMLASLRQLDEPHRQVILLLKIEERPVADVARLLGKTENAVRILYCRALKALRVLLGVAESGERPETNSLRPR